MNRPDSHRACARLVPEVPLPPYSYVTGRFPHPTSDPAGHSFGQLPEEPAALDPDRWHESRAFLFGCDLFNHGYYWEAHETWEAAWKGCGRRGTTADFLKGLIKLAAAGVKVREGRIAGVRRHGARAGQLFRGVRAALGGNRQTYLGLDVARLIAFADELAEGAQLPKPVEGAGSQAVSVVFTVQLLPADKA
jgi:hypothetical protein